LKKKPELTSESQVLEPYKEIIAKYDDSQKVEWIDWSGRLPKRIFKVSNLLVELAEKAKNWQYLNYLFIILSAAVPVIVTVLIEVLKLPYIASVLDLVFPAAVGVMEKISLNASQERDALIAVKSPYETLLSNVIVDIYQKTYSAKREIYEGRWDKLDTILANAKIPV